MQHSAEPQGSFIVQFDGDAFPYSEVARSAYAASVQACQRKGVLWASTRFTVVTEAEWAERQAN